MNRAPKMPVLEPFELDLAQEQQDAVDDRGRAAERREDHDQQDRHAEHERPDGEDRADDQADDHDDRAGPDAEVVEDADAEGVADRAAEDDDRGVVPEERDRGEDEPEDQPDAPRQDASRRSPARRRPDAPLGARRRGRRRMPRCGSRIVNSFSP